MGCQKKALSKKAKRGRFQCESCGVVRKKKKNLCAPKKLKKSGKA